MDTRKIILFALLILFMVIFNYFLPSTPNVIVSPSNINVSQGQSFELNVSIDPMGTPIAGVQTNVLYNSSFVKINSIKEGDILSQNGITTFFYGGIVNNSIGSAVNLYSFIFGPYNISTPGTFIVINMTATDMAGTSKINLSNIIITDQKGYPVPLNVYNTNVTIKQNTNNITFIITDIFTGKYIQGAAVYMDGITEISNINGEAIFNLVIPGSYNYSVNSKNYMIYTGNVTITDDIRQITKLTPKAKGHR